MKARLSFLIPTVMGLAILGCDRDDSLPAVKPAAVQPQREPLGALTSEALNTVLLENARHWGMSPKWDLRQATWRNRTEDGKVYYEATLVGISGASKLQDGFVEVRKLRCVIKPSDVSEGNRLNGITWTGRIYIDADICRDYDSKKQAWSNWRDFTSTGMSALRLIDRIVQQKNGSWTAKPPWGVSEATSGVAFHPQVLPK